MKNSHFGNLPYHLALSYLGLLLITALLSSWLASETDSFLRLIPYDAQTLDYRNMNYQSPLGEQKVNTVPDTHWLGTDRLGRDVLAMLIHGSKTALLIGFISIAIATLIGIFLGSFSAYFGDRMLGIKLVPLLVALFGSMFLVLLIILQASHLSNANFWAYILGWMLLASLLYFICQLSAKYSKKRMYLPLDILLGRLMEIMDSLPLLFIIITLSALVKPNFINVILLIGLTAWVGIARLSRAEVLKLKELNFIESQRAMGLSHLAILFKHLIPNVLPALMVTIAFAVSAAILIESTLSFLGFGIGHESASWGSIIASARHYPQAWWLIIFPGLAIFFTVLSCNIIGERLTRRKSG